MANTTLRVPLLPFSGGWASIPLASWWAPLALTLALWLISRLLKPPHSPRNTPEVRALPGPARPRFGWLLGNMAQLADHRETLIHPDWFQWGWTGVYESLFAQKRIYTFDPAAVGYIFAHPDEFERPRDLRTILGHIMGADSLVVNEGEKHRRMRRALNPAFSAGAIKEMMPAMLEKAGEMVALFERLIDEEALESYAARAPAPEDRVPGARKIDVFKFAGNLTTDIIGIAGFEHDFNSLSPEDDSPALLANRFNRLVDAANGMVLLTEAQNIMPVLDKIPTQSRRVIGEVRGQMERLSDTLFARRKEVGYDPGAKDLLSLLVKSASATKSDAAMSHDEVRAQMASLLFAGSTTTAATISFILFELAKLSEWQEKLRAEVLAGHARPSFEALNAFPLLDAVIRETLRLHPPASCTCRATTKDMVLPLAKPIPLRDGRTIDALPVSKGSYFFISMVCLNRLKEIWGDDAEEFNPARHADPALPRMQVPGVWGNVSSFISGPHACIGYRLAIIEIKVVLHALLRAFEFELLPSRPHIQHFSSLATQPQVKGEPGGQMPLLVRRHRV
ncbi:cytochrome P450 [Cutaneotrichosporon oleaginosum]|uniref:Cytochrome P450 n=1 Tax=Cutaneotrichosporon oleaginosum TaxID=879819 RepID=A0A0J0XUE3_9TREE|nr:cytochrome P450 [Cutaneotrichosporon oleaginosum]KLT44703.1 cytochrome P450 [Cutaneotrichosporon oleaginosum]TXT07688.1 hypothetical protein COLE_04612 [Cutaneotrichosporon oleaginosum]